MENELQKKSEERLLLVKTSTDASKLGSSIVMYYEQNQKLPITLRVIGAGAMNQAVKGAIISNKFFCRKGFKAALVPSFKDLEGNVTAVQFNLLLLPL